MIELVRLGNSSGHFKLYKNSKKIVDQPNTLVNGLLTVLARRAWNNPTPYVIDQYQVGTGTAATNIADNTLGTWYFTKTAVAGAQLTSVQYRISGTIDSMEANEQSAFTEMGLFCSALTTMVARVVFDPQEKLAGVEYRFEWDFTIAW